MYWLGGPDEGAHELAVDIPGDRVDVDALARHQFASVLDPVNAGRLDANLLEAGGLQFRAVIVFLERARDAVIALKPAAS